MIFAGLSRPFGTRRMANLNPAVNRRAILKSPSGRGEPTTQIDPNPERGHGCPRSSSPRFATSPCSVGRWNLMFALWGFFWILSFEPGASAAPRLPWTSNRVTGSPNPPAPFTVERVFPQLTFNNPLDLTFAPGTDRLFIAEQGGKLWSFSVRATNPQPQLALDLPKHHQPFDNILGFTFHPGFATNHFIFITFHVSRFTLQLLRPSTPPASAS